VVFVGVPLEKFNFDRMYTYITLLTCARCGFSGCMYFIITVFAKCTFALTELAGRIISGKWYQNLYNKENYRINIYLGKNQMYYSIPCHNYIKTKWSSTSTTHAWRATGKSSLTHIVPLNCQATANVTISNIS